MTTDKAIISRLNEVAKFTPHDGWQHVIWQLRKGRLYFVNNSGKKQVIKLVYPIKLRT